MHEMSVIESSEVADGSVEPCKLLLAPNLQYFQLVTDGVIHDVPLKSIKDLCRAAQGRI